MPCGNVNNGVVCDNAGTATHAGMHSGMKSQFWGLFSVRVFWGNSTDHTPAALKKLEPGVLAHTKTGFLNEVPTAQLVPGRLNKSGNQTITRNTWTTVDGWTVPAGFESTPRSGAGILMEAAGTVRVRSNLRLSSVNRYDERGIRILRNTEVIATFTTGGFSNVDTAVDHPLTTPTFTVAAGDVIFAQAYQANSGTAERTVTAGTWYEVEVA